MWLMSAGGGAYLVVAVPDAPAGWVPVADVLLLAPSVGETPEELLARCPGVSAVARTTGHGAVTLTHRTGRVAATAGGSAAPIGAGPVDVARAVALLLLLTCHAIPSSRRRTGTASVSASRV
ncbi:hypothetical protein JCM9534A_10960 [Catenuloplanes indicus JCM 9534]